MKTNNTRLWIYILLVIPFIQNCDCNKEVVKPTVVNHPFVYIVDKVGRIVLTATSPPGEQMIGGGYSVPDWTFNRSHWRHSESARGEENYLDETATICDEVQGPIYVEASYPSSKNTWTVIIYNPDPAPDCYNGGKLIQVDCYCVTNPSLHLNMKIDSVPTHVTNVPTAPSILIDSCNVPDGCVVTAGGFKLQPLDDNNSVLGYNLPLWGSYPTINPQNKAIGWTNEYQTNSLVRPYNITTYVLYSSPIPIYLRPAGSQPAEIPAIPSPLIDGPVKTTDANKSNSSSYTIGEVACDPGYFSSGGGFKVFSSSHQHWIPIVSNSEAYVNGVQIPFAGWHSQTSNNNTVYTLQIKTLPNNLKVVITNPPNGIYLTEEMLNNKIKFAGYAIDHDGSSIPENNLKWEVSGGSDGSGETFETMIDKESGDYDTYRLAKRYIVKLTATSKEGDKASTYIYLYYQNIDVL